MKTTTRMVLAAGAVPLALLGFAGTALADDGVARAASGARTEYYDGSDIVIVYDTYKDSHGAVGWIEVQQANGSYKAFPHVYAGRGAGTSELVHQDVLRETSRIKVVSCLQDGVGGKPWNCGQKYING